MTTAQLRKQLKSLGFKLQLSTSSLGTHAGIMHIATGAIHGNVQTVANLWDSFHGFAVANREALLEWAKAERVFGVKSWFTSPLQLIGD